MISEGSGFARSCSCGKANRLMAEKFKDVSLDQLLSYGRRRAVQKKVGSSNPKIAALKHLMK
jgi:hypothetical protein